MLCVGWHQDEEPRINPRYGFGAAKLQLAFENEKTFRLATMKMRPAAAAAVAADDDCTPTPTRFPRLHFLDDIAMPRALARFEYQQVVVCASLVLRFSTRSRQRRVRLDKGQGQESFPCQVTMISLRRSRN